MPRGFCAIDIKYSGLASAIAKSSGSSISRGTACETRESSPAFCAPPPFLLAEGLDLSVAEK